MTTTGTNTENLSPHPEMDAITGWHSRTGWPSRTTENPAPIPAHHCPRTLLLSGQEEGEKHLACPHSAPVGEQGGSGDSGNARSTAVHP